MTGETAAESNQCERRNADGQKDVAEEHNVVRGLEKIGASERRVHRFKKILMSQIKDEKETRNSESCEHTATMRVASAGPN